MGLDWVKKEIMTNLNPFCYCGDTSSLHSEHHQEQLFSLLAPLA